MKKKTKRILALCGVILLLGMYVITFILALTTNEATKGFFMASVACTFLVPIFIYAMQLVANFLRGKGSDENTPSEKPSDRQ